MANILKTLKLTKKKIVILIAGAVLSAVGYFVLGVPPDVSSIGKGDLSTIGQTIEDAPE